MESNEQPSAAREYHYYDGTIVRLGDRVSVWGELGVVDMVIQPGTMEAGPCETAQAGILVRHDRQDGRATATILPWPDGDQWEDLELLQREAGSSAE